MTCCRHHCNTQSKWISRKTSVTATKPHFKLTTNPDAYKPAPIQVLFLQTYFENKLFIPHHRKRNDLLLSNINPKIDSQQKTFEVTNHFLSSQPALAPSLNLLCRPWPNQLIYCIWPKQAQNQKYGMTWMKRLSSVLHFLLATFDIFFYFLRGILIRKDVLETHGSKYFATKNGAK